MHNRGSVLSSAKRPAKNRLLFCRESSAFKDSSALIPLALNSGKSPYFTFFPGSDFSLTTEQTAPPPLSRQLWEIINVWLRFQEVDEYKNTALLFGLKHCHVVSGHRISTSLSDAPARQRQDEQPPLTGHLGSPEPTVPQGLSGTQESRKQSTLPSAHQTLLIHRRTQMYKRKKKRTADYFL